MANMWGKKENGQPFVPADFFPSLNVERYEDQDNKTLQKQVESNIAAMQMMTWNLKSLGYRPDPSLTSDEQTEMAKLMQVEMPTG